MIAKQIATNKKAKPMLKWYHGVSVWCIVISIWDEANVDYSNAKYSLKKLQTGDY